MDNKTFDRLTRRCETLLRSITERSSRRILVRSFTAPALIFANASFPEVARAKSHGKKLKRNAFGCVNAGGKCRGKDQVCCSGICEGKKPKRGEKDKSRCVAHDESSCEAGQTIGLCGGENVACVTSTGHAGTCVTTTGNAGYCQGKSGCVPCTTDVDCRVRCGPRAACATCDAGICLFFGVRTLCVGPSEEACNYPDIEET